MSLVRVVPVVVRLVAVPVRGPKRLIFKGPPCIESSFWHFGTGPSSGGSKRLIFKGRACTESSFLGFGTSPGFGEAQNSAFIKAALVQNRHS